MAGKRTSASLTADEVARQKEPSLSGKSSSSGYFSTVFPPTSTVMANGLPQLDLYRTLNKQSPDTNTGSAQRKTTENQKKGSGSPSKSIYPSESTELAYFGSSVHYGARDFYTTSSATNTCVNRINHYKTYGEDDSGNSNSATRGEWWQGSLYY
ncbi:hypothetical protein MUK42_08548 [Musa troglodytarum]|uniref:Uncharacterized protein n=1 Tax=Musa troglodytarum TaxID=320322 RepID=A0A9E7JB68_9LILI|nr:hypothetical protein MUK42_08548 [Musa troglodytarum]